MVSETEEPGLPERVGQDLAGDLATTPAALSRHLRPVAAPRAGGVLAPVACDPATICMTGSDPDVRQGAEGIVIDPSGTHLYVTNVLANSVSVFSIGAGGVLAPVACDPRTICKTGSNPTAIAVDPSGSHLFNSSSGGGVSVFSIGTSSPFTPLVVGKETISPSAFAAARSAPSALSAGSRAHGATVTYTLSLVARVRFTVQHPAPRAHRPAPHGELM